MQPNKTKIALVIGALLLGASGASNAATGNFDVSITTIADIGFIEISPISLGSAVFLTAGGSCTVKGSDPTAGDVFGDTGLSASGTNGTLTGDCKGTGAAGVYEVESAGPSDAITVLMGDMVEAGGFSFNPSSNCIPLYDGTLGTDDSCQSLTVDFAHLTAITGDGADGGSIANKLRFTIGGTMTIGAADLTPNTPYAGSFAINVIYQ
tara:strand:- start:55195 stop:55818 length:624 start_codon:yes stop_codon:yes gene_type:complete